MIWPEILRRFPYFPIFPFPHVFFGAETQPIGTEYSTGMWRHNSNKANFVFGAISNTWISNQYSAGQSYFLMIFLFWCLSTPFNDHNQGKICDFKTHVNSLLIVFALRQIDFTKFLKNKLNTCTVAHKNNNLQNF